MLNGSWGDQFSGYHSFTETGRSPPKWFLPLFLFPILIFLNAGFDHCKQIKLRFMLHNLYC